MTVHFGKATVTVSGDFIRHVRFIFEKALDDVLKKAPPSRPRSTSGALALPAYLVAVRLPRRPLGRVPRRALPSGARPTRG